MQLSDIETMQHTMAAVDCRIDSILQTQPLFVKRDDKVYPVHSNGVMATFCFDHASGELVIDGCLRANPAVTFNTIRVPLELLNCDDETFHKLLDAHVARQKQERAEAERIANAKAEEDAKQRRYESFLALKQEFEAGDTSEQE